MMMLKKGMIRLTNPAIWDGAEWVLINDQTKRDEMIKSINDVDQDKIRQDLFYWIQDNPTPLHVMAKDMDIAQTTLDHFLSGQRKATSFHVLMKVAKFLRDKYAARDEEIRKNLEARV